MLCLHCVKLGVLGDQPGELLDAVQGRGGAAGLQDEPSPRDEHRALGQHVGVNPGVPGGGDDSAVHDGEEILQPRPEMMSLVSKIASSHESTIINKLVTTSAISTLKTKVYESINEAGDDSGRRYCVTLLLSGDPCDVRRQVLGHRG